MIERAKGKARHEEVGCPACRRMPRSASGAGGGGGSASTDDGRRAIIDALGRAYFRDLVECYVAGHPGAALAWSVLSVLKPRLIRAWILPSVRTRSWSSPRVQAAADLIALVVIARDAPLVSAMIGSRNAAIRSAGARAAVALVEHGGVSTRVVDGWIDKLLAAAPGWAHLGALLLDLRVGLGPIAAPQQRRWVRRLRALRDPSSDALTGLLEAGS